MDTSSQAEWEARACWGVPSSSTVLDVPLQGPSVGQSDTVQEAKSVQTAAVADVQDTDALDTAAEQSIRTTDESELTQHGVGKKAAATAALQKALSNIQYIATGSQKARAAAAAASAAEAGSAAGVLTHALQSNPDYIAAGQAAADVVDTALAPVSAAGQQTADKRGSSALSEAAEVQQGTAADFTDSNLAAESSNGSHFTLDTAASCEQAKMLGCSVPTDHDVAQHAAADCAGAGAEHDGLVMVHSMMLDDRADVADDGAALQSDATPEQSADAAASALPETQRQGFLQSSPSVSGLQSTIPPTAPSGDGATPEHTRPELSMGLPLSYSNAALSSSVAAPPAASRRVSSSLASPRSEPAILPDFEGSPTHLAQSRVTLSPEFGPNQDWSQLSGTAAGTAALQQSKPYSTPAAASSTSALHDWPVSELEGQGPVPAPVPQLSGGVSTQSWHTLPVHSLDLQEAVFDTASMTAEGLRVLSAQGRRDVIQPQLVMGHTEPGHGVETARNGTLLSQVRHCSMPLSCVICICLCMMLLL